MPDKNSKWVIKINFNYTVTHMIIILLLCCFCLPAAGMAEGIDQEIREIVLKSENNFLDKTMSGITYLGNGVVNLAIASVLPDKKARTDAQKAVIVGGAAALGLKIIIGQKRPPGPVEYHHITLNNEYHAMPSGHTTTAFALAATIARHYPRYKELSYITAALVGISRLYKDVHWASNAAAGAGLGYLSAKFVELKW